MKIQLATRIAVFGGVLLSLFSCGSSGHSRIEEEEVTSQLAQYRYRPHILVQEGIKLTEVLDYPPFDDVSLSLLAENVRFRPGKNRLEFIIGKFFLGEHTAEERELGTQVNEGGQYLLLFDPKSGKRQKYYSADIEQELAAGDNFIGAFLVRSNHISLKGDSAMQLYKVSTDQKEGEGNRLVERSKAVFFDVLSPSPDQVYLGKQKVLIDFLTNVSDWNRHNIELNIDGEVFLLENGNPYVMEGMEYGKHKISARLLDSNKELVKSELSTSKHFSFEVTEESGF